MTFQYCGLGVGHKSTWEATKAACEEICNAFDVLLEVQDNAIGGTDTVDVEMDIAGNVDDSNGDDAGESGDLPEVDNEEEELDNAEEELDELYDEDNN